MGVSHAVGDGSLLSGNAEAEEEQKKPQARPRSKHVFKFVICAKQEEFKSNRAVHCKQKYRKSEKCGE